ncbi:hypothetical protein F8388_026872 [Cannabis sativa]|uniref:Uncharacterized protein n=1 Tax=Cannabis sativa TaxID=3483 RepID=A0A7J6H1V0_CANSA|nr:hypothetical protein F8388_026870 [Cannabis sativa]KAF4389143.1 hypothetical protein F8388_026872 [Cannabis sativa]
MNMRHKKIKSYSKYCVVSGCIQRQMARILTLDFQLHCLDYEAENWYHADLDFETFKLLQWYRKILILVIVLIYLIFDFFSTYGVTELSLLAKNFSHIDTPFFSSREVYPPWHYILSMWCATCCFSSWFASLGLSRLYSYEILMKQFSTIIFFQLQGQSRQDLKYESDSEYICRAPVPGITLEKKGNAAEKEKDKEMIRLNMVILHCKAQRIYLQLITYHSNIIGNDHSANLKVIVVQY